MYSNILIPVIVDETHDNTQALAVARTLADPGARFTLLHVMESIPSFVLAELPDTVLTKAQDEIAMGMSKLAESLPGARAQMISGHAGQTILDYANQYGTDCIIVRSHRPGINDFFLGSTAARVVRHAQCSVHVVR